MQTRSKQNLLKCALPSAVLMLLAASLTGCSTLSEIVEANKAAELKARAPAEPAKTVAVVVPAPPAKLPDIPESIRKCLPTKAEKEKAGSTADDTVKALYAKDKTKAECARKLFAWYKQQQDSVATSDAKPLPDGHPKTAEKKGKTATWE